MQTWSVVLVQDLPEHPALKLAISEKVLPQLVVVSQACKVWAPGTVQVKVEAGRSPNVHCDGLAKPVAGLSVLICICIHLST